MKILKIDKCYNCPELGEDRNGNYCRRSMMRIKNGNVINPNCKLEDEKEEFLNILKEEGEK